MFKLQYYLLILTFSLVYKNQKKQIKIYPPCPPPPPAVAKAQRLALGILQGRGLNSLLGNKDEPIFRGYVLTDQPELLVYLLQAVSVDTNSLD